jgi:cyclopropane-fatty-acyl-phospholipid synthase
MLFEGYIQRLIRVGRLTVIGANGRTTDYGDGSGVAVTVRLKPGALLKIILNPSLALGECFMTGDLVVEQGDIYDLLEIVARNMVAAHRPRILFERLWFALERRLGQINDRRAARRNVAHHYDLSYDLYRRFLDADMQYSCAYFPEPDVSLEAAQTAKKAHIAAKLRLGPEVNVLDIGCGWGGLSLSLAQHAPGARVVGVTLSKEQLAVARARARDQRLDDQVRFELCDYRDIDGTFDRIVSVGMFEHVGRPNYQAYFDAIARLLDEDGVALVHSIGRRGEPGVTDPFIRKYIFPGGYIPALSEVLPAIERAGLWVTDIEILRLHYADTLRIWRERFEAQAMELGDLSDDKFRRMWSYYLASSEIAFRWFGFMNFQIQLTKRVDALPLTRDYMQEQEQALMNAQADAIAVRQPEEGLARRTG